MNTEGIARAALGDLEEGAGCCARALDSRASSARPPISTGRLNLSEMLDLSGRTEEASPRSEPRCRQPSTPSRRPTTRSWSSSTRTSCCGSAAPRRRTRRCRSASRATAVPRRCS